MIDIAQRVVLRQLVQLPRWRNRKPPRLIGRDSCYTALFAAAQRVRGGGGGEEKSDKIKICLEATSGSNLYTTSVRAQGSDRSSSTRD